MTSFRQGALQYPLTNTLVTCSIALMGGLVVLETGNLIAGSRYWLTWFLLVLLALAILLPVLIEVLRHQFDLLNLKNAFLFFILMQYVVWPISAYTGIYDEEPFFGFRITFLTWRYSSFLVGECYVVLGVLAFYVGYYALGTSRFARAAATEDRPWNGRRLIVVSALFASVSLAAFVALTGQGESFLDFFNHIDQFRNTGLLGVGYLTATINLVRLASLALLCHYFEKRKYRSLTFSLTLLAVLLALLAASRHAAVDAVVSFFVVRNYLGKPLRINAKTIAAATFLWLANVSYVYYRKFGVATFDELQNMTVGRIFFLIVPRFIGAEAIARIVDVTERSGFQGGWFLLRDLITGWVPRGLWPAKPLSSGLVVNTTFYPDAFVGGETGAAVPTLVGELYWIAGVVGVLVGMLLLGLLFRRAYSLVQFKNKNSIGLYSLVYMLAFFVNETLSLHLFRFLFQIVVWHVLMRLVRDRAPEVAPSGGR